MSGFFKFLWRLNAVLAFAALLAAIVFLTLFSKERMTQPLLNYFVPPPLAPVVKVQPTYSYVLEPDMVIGASTDELSFNLYRLVRWGKIHGRPVTPEAETVNILVTDKKTNANKWLFKGFDRVIVGQDSLLTGRWYYHEPVIDENVPLHLLVLRLVETDTNGDGVLGVGDRQTLYICRFEGGEPEKLMTADQIWFTNQSGKTYLVSYRDKGVAWLTTYSLPDFKVISQTEIKEMPN